MKQKLYFTIGLPGSGKTYWAFSHIKNNPNTIRLNKDSIRSCIYLNPKMGIKYSKEMELYVNIFERKLAREALSNGLNIIVDNTHLNNKHRFFYEDLAYHNDVEFIVKDFTGVPVEECIRRDSLRNNPVGEKEIVRIAKFFGLYEGEGD